MFLTRDSRVLARGLKGRVRAFAEGIYSRSGRRLVSSMIRRHKPDIIHVHEIYPFFSISALAEAKRSGIPVVMTCHDYRLTCPVATHLSRGRLCERCKGGREHYCVLKNCRGDILESLGFALRSALARKSGLLDNGISRFIVLTEFARKLFSSAGFAQEKLFILPNWLDAARPPADSSQGRYGLFVGRICPEKGIDTFVRAARQVPTLPLYVSGDGPLFQRVQKLAPSNVRFLGHLNGPELTKCYEGARFLALPSEYYEGFPIVALEAMSYGLPIIASRIGGLPEIVEDGVTGLLFEPGNDAELGRKMSLLWENPDLGQRLGRAGYNRVRDKYNVDRYYQGLMSLYRSATEGTIASRS